MVCSRERPVQVKFCISRLSALCSIPRLATSCLSVRRLIMSCVGWSCLGVVHKNCSSLEAIFFFAAPPLYSSPCRGSFQFASSCRDLARRLGSSSDAALRCIPQSFFSGCVLLILVARRDARYPSLITRRTLGAESISCSKN